MDKNGKLLLAQMGVQDSVIARVRSALISIDSDETTLNLRLSVVENGKELNGFAQQFKKFKLVEDE